MDGITYAVLIGKEWYLATPSTGAAYGLVVTDGGTDKVWSELRTTALLCRVGEERAHYALPTPTAQEET